MVIIAALSTVLIYQNKQVQDAQGESGKLRDQMAVMERTHGQETRRLLEICDSQKTAIRIEEKADLKQQIQEQREIMNAALKAQQPILSQLQRAQKK